MIERADQVTSIAARTWRSPGTINRCHYRLFIRISHNSYVNLKNTEGGHSTKSNIDTSAWP